MDGFKAFPCLQVTTAAVLLIFAVVSVNGQISTPCTASMVSSFTPCLNYITGSTGNGASPTGGCCDVFKSLMSTSMDCTCLLVTGSVPFSLPTSTPLAISLPRACKTSLPIQCKASGVPLPAPGPALFAPPPPVAVSPLSPRASKATAIAPARAETTTATPQGSPSPSAQPQLAPTETTPDELAPTATGIRPVLTPVSSTNPSSMPSSLLLLILAALVMTSKFY